MTVSGIGSSSSSSASAAGDASSSDPQEKNLSTGTPSPTPSGPPPGGLGRIESGTGETEGNPGGIRAQVIPLGRGGTFPDTGDGSLEHLATLNVGDRFASAEKNSPETARMAGPQTPGRASYSVSVPSSEPKAPPSPTAKVGTSNVSSRGSENADDSSAGNSSPATYYIRRKKHFISDTPHALGVGGGTPVFSSAPPSPSSGDSSVASPSSTSSSRYVLDAHDVHSMGGASSSIQISNSSGEVMKSIDLPPGNSRVIVDLPPGEYTFTAVSAQRPGTGPSPNADNLDNFRLDISKASPSASGGGGLGSGSSGPT